MTPIESPFFKKPVRYKVTNQRLSSMKLRRRNRMKTAVKKIKVFKYYDWSQDILQKVT